VVRPFIPSWVLVLFLHSHQDLVVILELLIMSSLLAVEAAAATVAALAALVD
jgi:hypothetical protein